MNDRARLALGGGRFDSAIIAASCVVGLVLAPLAIVVTHGGEIPSALETQDFVVGAATLASTIGAAVFAILVIATPQRVSREMTRLGALPFPFDRDGYLELLGQDHAFMQVSLRIHFAMATIARADLNRIGTALKPNVESARVDDDGTLRISSPTIDAEFGGSGAPNVQHGRSNERVHRWLVNECLPLLVAIHSCAPIAKIDFVR